jgi:tRNA A-37 threonylcarbamoyl transferase component Bud32
MEPEVPNADPLIGTTIDGRYRVDGLLGRGGMGVVFRVEHVLLKKEMALKILLRDLGGSDELVQRFRREAEAVAQLQHQNIIAVTDFGRTEDGRMYLVMELLDGPSLAKVLEGGVALPVERALHIERQILRALEHAHAMGIVHRDLKPDNIILVERDGVADTVKLLDFGIAKLLREQTDAGASLVTVAGAIFGTPEYMAPEQAVGDAVDQRVDVYAAGVILYEMLAGRRPFVSDSRFEIISMHVTQDAMPVAELAPEANVPPHVSSALATALNKRRDDRWATAARFLEALDAREDVASPPLSLPQLSPVRALEQQLAARGVPRARVAAWGVVLGVALLVIGIAGLLVRPARVPASSTGAPAPGLLGGMLAPAPDLSKADKTLRTGRTCKERRAAAQQLIDSHDKQWLGSLQAAKDRHGGFLDLERVNGCMLRELDAAIRKLDEP